VLYHAIAGDGIPPVRAWRFHYLFQNAGPTSLATLEQTTGESLRGLPAVPREPDRVTYRTRRAARARMSLISD
jgi:hypothetical protein